MSDRPIDSSFSPASHGNFRVTWGIQAPSLFEEANGLEEDIGMMEHRRRAALAEADLPVSAVGGNITLKRGVVAANDRLWNWYSAAAEDHVIRSVVLIDLVDDDGTPLMTWLLKNAWPTKLTAAAVTASAGPVAVETIVLAFDTIAITNG